MRAILTVTIVLLADAQASAEGLIKREPRIMQAGATVYVDNGACSPGKVLRVTAAFKGPSRKKTCVSLDPKEASRTTGEAVH